MGNSVTHRVCEGKNAEGLTVTVQGTGDDWGVSAETAVNGASVAMQISRSVLSNSGRAAVVSAAGGGIARVDLTDNRISGSAVGLYQTGSNATLTSLRNNVFSGNGIDSVGTVQNSGTR